MCAHFITHFLRLVGRLGFCNRFNHTSCVAVVTPIYRPKSVRNRCVTEVYGGGFFLSFWFLFSVSVRAFVIGLSHVSCFPFIVSY